MDVIRQLWAYREMIYMLVLRELRGRYKGSFLGFLWTFLNPLLQFLVYFLIFSQILRMDIEKYYIYLFVGFIPWFFVSTAIPQGANCILSQSNLVQKIYFPRMVLPISAALTGFINMLLSEIVVFVILIVSGFGISIHSIALPIVYLIQLLIVTGIILLVSAVTVYFRDLSHILDILVMAWFYITPIVYPVDMIPEKFSFFLYINPMTSVIASYQNILYYQRWPDFWTLLPAFAIGVILLIVGGFVFQKLQQGFAEEL